MKKILSLLAISFLFTNLSLADGSDYEEITYIFRSFESETVPDPQECIDIGWPSFNEPIVALFDIYRIKTKENTGAAKKQNYKKPIGQVLTCADWTGFSEATAFDPIPVRFKATLDGMELILEGEGRYYSFNVPEFPVALGGYVLRVISGPEDILGGQLVTNTLTSLAGASPPGYVSGSIANLRLYKNTTAGN